MNNIKKILNTIFSLRPPSHELGKISTFPAPEGDIGAFQNNVTNYSFPGTQSAFQSDNKLDYRRTKIKFDNIFRISVSTVAFFVCLLMVWGGSVHSLPSILGLFMIYGALQLGVNYYLIQTKWVHQLDYTVCILDIIGLSYAVYLTGGPESGLYFLYFVPLLVQSYHRDWELIVTYGFGGTFLYSGVTFLAFKSGDVQSILDLSARLFFMLLTVSIATLAVQLLRKRDSLDQMRFSRMQTLTQISQLLNSITTGSDLSRVVRDVVAHLNDELGSELNAWVRAFLVEKNGAIMNAVADPRNTRLDLKQEIAAKSCPAFHNNQTFSLGDSQHEEPCPTEQFNFKSHICFPILGTENESFGVLFAGSEFTHAFKGEEKLFLKFVARSLGLTIQRLNRVEELRKVVEMDSCATATFLKSTRSLDELYKSILEGSSSILKVENVSLMVWEKSEGKLVTRFCTGPYAGMAQKLKVFMGEGVPGKALESGHPTWATEIDFLSNLNERKHPFKGVLSIPFFNFKSEPLGVVNAWVEKFGRSFSPFELDLISTFVTRAAVAIENARLHQQERDGMAGFVSPDNKEEAA